jgi:hypothetical protein
MSQRASYRTIGVAACGTAVFMCGMAGAAKPKTASDKRPSAACVTSYNTAQERERAGRLREAKDLLTACAKPACGSLEKKCAAEGTQLDSELPEIVPVLTDEAGAPMTEVRVKVDGELMTAQLDGRAFAVDPGVHEFSFGNDSGVLATQKIMIVQGQRGAVSVSLQTTGKSADKAAGGTAASPSPVDAKTASDKSPPDSSTASVAAAAPPDPPKGGPSPFAFVFSGVALAGAGGYALTTYWGSKDNSALAKCSPNCSQDSVDHVRTLYLAGDISLGLGFAALGLATFLFATGSSAPEKPASPSSVSFDVHPAPSGGVASVRGTF